MSEAFVHRMPVRFADVDHAGIVYYPRFFHYFHVTFEEFFRVNLGAHAYVSLLDDEKIGFPAVHSECDYKAPLRFGESVEIEMRLERLGGKSISVVYSAFRAQDEAGERTLAAQGRVVAAVVDLSVFKATELPARIRELFLGIAVDQENSH